ncbi:hypothetical protein D1007_12262 [Hordeum vulgare]|nr:hypothetical protein D1007_12262 [Hordeum vulgare]
MPPMPPAAQPIPSATNGRSCSGKDPVDDFFKAAKKPTIACVVVDPLVADVQDAADAAVAAPLDFGDNFFQDDVDAAERVQLDMFSPTLFAATTDYG